jgi:hypothetical protein
LLEWPSRVGGLIAVVPKSSISSQLAACLDFEAENSPQRDDDEEIHLPRDLALMV